MPYLPAFFNVVPSIPLIHGPARTSSIRPTKFFGWWNLSLVPTASVSIHSCRFQTDQFLSQIFAMVLPMCIVRLRLTAPNFYVFRLYLAQSGKPCPLVQRAMDIDGFICFSLMAAWLDPSSHPAIRRLRNPSEVPQPQPCQIRDRHCLASPPHERRYFPICKASLPVVLVHQTYNTFQKLVISKTGRARFELANV